MIPTYVAFFGVAGISGPSCLGLCLLIGGVNTYSGILMRLTTFTDYGLRMLMRMGSAPDRAFSTAELAEEFQLSRNHLSKIMQRLAKAKLVRTRRGGGGGATLARRPEEIRLGDVVRLLEEGQTLVECLQANGGDCTINGCCRLKPKLRIAEMAFIDALNRSTLADVSLTPPQSELSPT